MPHTARHGSDDDGTWAGNEDGDTDGSGGGGGGGNGDLWSTIAPKSVRTFASAPIGFIIGAFLDIFVGGIEDMLVEFIDAILAVFDAIASVPQTTQSLLLDKGAGIGSAVLDVLSSFFGAFETAAGAAGPVAPLFAALLLGIGIIAVAYALRFVWTLLVDSLNPL